MVWCHARAALTRVRAALEQRHLQKGAHGATDYWVKIMLKSNKCGLMRCVDVVVGGGGGLGASGV